MRRRVAKRGAAPFLPGAGSLARPQSAVGFQQKRRVLGRCSQKPAEPALGLACRDMCLPGGTVFETGLSRNAGAFQQKLSVKLSLMCP